MVVTACLPAGADPSETPQTSVVTSTPAATPTQELLGTTEAGDGGFVVVDTAQGQCYDTAEAVSCPAEGQAFRGQDAQYAGAQARYDDNGDGTVTELQTGLMWQQDPGEKLTYAEALAGADAFDLAGYDDWRLPSIKELYSLILFSGVDVSGWQATEGAVPFIDTDYFIFQYRDTSQGERLIDSQYASSTVYVHQTMGGDETVFGVNFADGRIKGYGISVHGEDKTFFVLYVRGDSRYGSNEFVDNGDGTVTDLATGLMWMLSDSGAYGAGSGGDGALYWEEALSWCEDLSLAGLSDWRLPDAKELQSIVDYSRSPATSNSPAIDPIFNTTSITDEGGGANYPFFWTSTTHQGGRVEGGFAVYVAFGEALGWMRPPSGEYELLDVHGAGAQRSDPKSGDAADYPYGNGPQGDVVRILNYARCVRGGGVLPAAGEEPPEGSSPAATPTQPAPQDGPPEGGSPPQEAIDACTGANEGGACQFVAPAGTVVGVCRRVETVLACVP